MLKNLNIGYLFLGFALLVSTKILLLNEESLVLLCFVAFTYLVISKLGNNVSVELDKRADKIKFELNDSFKEVENHLRTTVSMYNLNYGLKEQINSLKNFCDLNTKNLVYKMHENLNFHVKTEFPKKLSIVLIIEEEVNFLLCTLFCLELDKMINLNRFYVILGLSRYIIINQIGNQERIMLI